MGIDPSDAEIVTAIRDGARTESIADRVGQLQRRPYILRRLKRLEASGRVERHPRYSFPSSFYWVRAGDGDGEPAGTGETIVMTWFDEEAGADGAASLSSTNPPEEEAPVGKPWRPPTLRYRCPASWDAPLPGTILMGTGPRVRRAYRILGAVRCNGTPALGEVTWRIRVEPMSAEQGRREVDAGVVTWAIHWDRRERRRA